MKRIFLLSCATFALSTHASQAPRAQRINWGQYSERLAIEPTQQVIVVQRHENAIEMPRIRIQPAPAAPAAQNMQEDLPRQNELPGLALLTSMSALATYELYSELPPYHGSGMPTRAMSHCCESLPFMCCAVTTGLFCAATVVAAVDACTKEEVEQPLGPQHQHMN